MSKKEEPMEEIMETKVMWYPDSKKITQMDLFRSRLNSNFGLNLANYNDLYKWSVECYPDFWGEFWDFGGIVFSRIYDEVIDRSKGIADIPEWFHGSQLNYAENLLKHKENDKIALYGAREGREDVEKVTFEELRRNVALYAAAMRKMGVGTGDRVVGYLPNCIQTVEAMLAASSIGAIWSATSPDFGVNVGLNAMNDAKVNILQ